MSREFIEIGDERYYVDSMIRAYNEGCERRKAKQSRYAVSGHGLAAAKYSIWYEQGFNNEKFVIEPLPPEQELNWGLIVGVMLSATFVAAAIGLAL